ncbi:MAG: desulfoferrodoxin [Acidimicrobiia bacterium]
MSEKVAPAVGTRLKCEVCGTEIIVVKAPTGPISCCGREMAERAQGA